MMLDRIVLYPELAEYISLHLTHADLLCCIRVSKDWHAIFIRYLWETFSDNSSGDWFDRLEDATKHIPRDGQDLNWFRDVYGRHAGYIRHLEVCHPFIISTCFENAFQIPPTPSASPRSVDPTSSLITRLKSLTIKLHVYNMAKYLMNQPPDPKIFGAGEYAAEDILAEACWRLALSNPRLESFDCTKFRSLQLRMDKHPTALQAIKTLTMELPYGRVPRIPSNVVRLDSSLLRKESFNPKDTPGLINNTLQELYIKDEIRTVAHIKSLLVQLPSLRYLRLRRVHLKEDDEVPAVPDGDNWVSDLRVLLCGLYERKSPELVKIFPWMPNLVEFHHSYVSSPFTAALAKHCPLLEVVRVTYKGCRYTPRNVYDSIHDRVSILLTSCTKLKILDLQYETIDANRVADAPWVCLDLEFFRCGFVGLPYLSASDEAELGRIQKQEEDARRKGLEPELTRTALETQLLLAAEQGKAMRKGVLRQISLLTSLKHLTLNRDLKVGRGLFSRYKTSLTVYRSEKDGRRYFQYKDVMPDTLHLRLDTGLECLASLTKLELFGFESMDHRMGPAEIEWIARTFPKLKEVRGLAIDTHVGAERDPEMDALRKLMQSLRPDIIPMTLSGHGHQSITRTRLSPLELPHILEAIFSCLSQFTLRHCVRLVCKQWRVFVAPLIDPIDDGDVWSDDSCEKSLQGVMARLERKTILRIQIRLAISDAWVASNWAILLDTIQTLRTKSLMRIQRVHLVGSLFPESRFYPLLPLLSDTLTEIRMERVTHVNTHIGTILALCPRIQTFHISCSNSTCEIVHNTSPPWPGTPEAVSGLGTLRLEDLKIKHMHIETSVLETIIARSPHLRTIRLIELIGQNYLSAEGLPDRRSLIQLVAESCPRLEIFHFSANKECLEEGAWIEPHYQSPATELSHILHEYLCSSPHLLHLVAPGVFYRSEYMELRGDIGTDGLYQPKHWDSTTSHPPAGVRRIQKRVWACRRLQTLHIFFGSTPQEEASAANSRTLFGYITRVCPDLRELVIRKTALHVELDGGMCLLTRLHKLQRLTVASLMHATRFRTQDIEWMTKTNAADVVPKESTLSRQSKRLSRLLQQLIPKRLAPGLKLDIVGMRHVHRLYLRSKDVAMPLTVADMEGVGSEADLDAWRYWGQRYTTPSPILRVPTSAEGDRVGEKGEQEQQKEELTCWPCLEFFGLTFLKHRIKSPSRSRLSVPATEKMILAMMTQIRPEVEIRLDQDLFNELFSMS
ncbi:hypothetical protein BGX33_005071 [Mortierella sp. NVP41]|nr:hypothetical protein BGX33_005071 [Mortierella sp. NVP41]